MNSVVNCKSASTPSSGLHYMPSELRQRALRLRGLKELARLLRLCLHLGMAEAPDREQAASSDPPFDPTQPSLPVSYPITDVEALESRSYFSSFHYPFNKASVPLPASSVASPPRRRLLVCHDMRGGYVDDRWVQGGGNPDAYAIWHWYLMDVFVYFSHKLVTLPPPCWTNAAHTHGVKVLGTFITEWEEGKVACNTLLKTKKSAQMYAERLSELAAALGFDGWLINMEVNLNLEKIDNLKEFVSHLTQRMHSVVPGSLVIWYDSVTKDGRLNWQDCLNEKNKPFFDLCDGIFVNYTWKEDYPKLSAAFAGERRYDVYMGIDVFGRNTYGGGKWNTNIALDLLRRDDVSAAIFAPGWVYEDETKQEPDFQTLQNRWWGLVEKSWGTLQSYPKVLPFSSNFDQGHGFHFSIEGLQVASDPWNNISCQGFQPFLGSSVDPSQSTMQVFINFKDASYSGGGNITIKGSLKDHASFSTRLFQGQLSLDDLPVQISYSVRAEGNSVLGLSFGFSSVTGGKTFILISTAQGTLPMDPSTDKHDKFVYQQVKKAEKEGSVDAEWALYETSVKMSGYTLTDIHMICYMKGELGSLGPAIEESYHASLGHISMRASEQNMTLPPADSWVTEGQDISWSLDPHGTRIVSLKIMWKLKAGLNLSFLKYNIFVEKQEKQLGRGGTGTAARGQEFIGIARVEAFYASNLKVPTEAISLKFIIQACGLDGVCQDLSESPAFLLPVGS